MKRRKYPYLPEALLGKVQKKLQKQDKTFSQLVRELLEKWVRESA